MARAGMRSEVSHAWTSMGVDGQPGAGPWLEGAGWPPKWICQYSFLSAAMLANEEGSVFTHAHPLGESWVGSALAILV